MSSPTVLPIPEIDDTTSGLGEWVVTVFNNETNTYDEVIAILMIATHCTLQEASIETWEIDHLGQSVVHHGLEHECKRIASIIATIGIQVEVCQE